MRKTKKHKVYTIEQKNEIVRLYLERHLSSRQIMEFYEIGNKSKLDNWISQYRKYGTTVDNRGRGTKLELGNKGRPRKYVEDLNQLSKENLIERVKAYESIKKSLAYLLDKEQKRIIK
ncbi:MAG: transposase [Acholeplasmataceae bacterium]